MFTMHGCARWFLVLSISFQTGVSGWFTAGPGPTDGFTDCGGHLTDPSGTIISPNFDIGEAYPTNSNCTWKINVEEGHVIHLVFNFMDIEETNTCHYDHLRVIDIGYTDDLYCDEGNDLPSEVTSNTNTLILMFKSDSSGNYLGFNVSYTSTKHTGPKVCGIYKDYPMGTIGITDDQETNCTWKIQGSTGDRVQLFFTILNIPSDEDCSQEYIEVIENGVATHKFCGSVPPELITSDSESVTVNFVTQKPSTGKGFEALFLVADGNRTCGGILFDPVGTIESNDNDGDGLYDSYSICGWVIIAPKDRYIKLNFTSVDIESSSSCLYDVVQVYDGSPDTLLDKVCGNYTPGPGPVLYSNTNVMIVSFTSDSTINMKGFLAEYSHITADEIPGTTSKPTIIGSTSLAPEEMTAPDIQPESTTPPMVCGSNLTEATGEVMSPGFSIGSYPSYADCRWYIIAEEGVTIKLTFTDMNIESLPGGSCYFDSLEVKEPSGTLHGTFCGTAIPDPITSMSNVLILYFVSNSEFNRRGFRALYTTGDDGGLPVCRLLGNTEVVGKFGSYDLGTAASNGHGCSWIITAPSPEKIVQLYFTRLRINSSETEEINLNCELNYIEVVDDDESGIFCGNDRPPLITSSSNRLTVNVVIQNAVTDFEAHFSVVDKELKCGEIITARSGTITQGTYENDMSCYWSIIALDGRIINLDFTSVAIETEQIEFWTVCVDYVCVYDGSVSSLTKIGEVCGVSYEDDYPSFTSETNILYLYFYSDGNRVYQGFVADFTVYLTESTTPPSIPPVTPTLPWTTSTATTSPHITSEATSTIEIDGTSTALEKRKTTTEHEDVTVSTAVETDVTPVRVSGTGMKDTTVMTRSTEVMTGLTGTTNVSSIPVGRTGITKTEVITGSTEENTDLTGITDVSPILVSGSGATGATGAVIMTRSTERKTPFTGMTDATATGFITGTTDVMTGVTDTVTVTVYDKMTTTNSVVVNLTSAVTSIESIKTGTPSVETTNTTFSIHHQSTTTTVSSEQTDGTTELSATKTSPQPRTKTETRPEQSTIDTHSSSTEPSRANPDKEFSCLSLIISFISSLVCLIIHRT